MKNLMFLLPILICILCGCTPKGKLESKVKGLSNKECSVQETSDGTMYIISYGVLEEKKFKKDACDLKEYTDKVVGSLPTTELNDVIMNRETLSFADHIAWETSEIVVLLMKCTDPRDNGKEFKIKYIVREK